MSDFGRIEGIAAPLPLDDLDTDRLLPVQYMKGLTRDGLGGYLLSPLRYDEQGRERPEFILNQPDWRRSTIIVAGRNFGCGSSREHAVWALADHGIRCVIAPSFGQIFAINCRKNRLLLVELPESECEMLREELLERPRQLAVDLERQQVVTENGRAIPFAFDALDRRLFLEGLDDIGRTLALVHKLDHFELGLEAQ